MTTFGGVRGIWADDIPAGEPADIAEQRLRREYDAFLEAQAEERKLIDARNRKAEADAVAVAEAEREDAERKLVGIWSLRFQNAGPSVNEPSVIEARARELGIPLAALRSDNGDTYGNAYGIDAEWAKRSEAQRHQVERELALANQARLQRVLDKQAEWEAHQETTRAMER